MIDLTQEQKDLILESFQKDPNIINITKIVFEDQSLDGRSKEGRAVTKFLAKNGLKTKTTKAEKSKEINLTDEQLDSIESMKADGLNTSEIADILFSKNVVRLSVEWRTVNEIVNQDREEAREEAPSSYVVPNALSRIIKKINDSTGYGLEENKMSRNQHTCCSRLRINLSNSRFVAIVITTLILETRNYSNKNLLD